MRVGRFAATLTAALICATPTWAADVWQIIQAESSLAFAAHDNHGSPIGGGFAKLSGTITGDPDHLADSHIRIDVELGSLTADTPDTLTTLPGEDWFNTPKFPHAVYESRAITMRPDGGFEAQGDLMLHGIKAPVTLVFSFASYGPKPGAPGVLRAVAKGKAEVGRTAFKVGGSEWAGTLADPVDVTFTLTAEKPLQH